MKGRYHLTYVVTPRPEGLTREEIRALGDVGACDALFVISIIHADDGGQSTAIVSYDGRTQKPLDDAELFKQWTLIAHRLAESPTLGEGRKALAREVFEIVRKAVVAPTAPGGAA